MKVRNILITLLPLTALVLSGMAQAHGIGSADRDSHHAYHDDRHACRTKIDHRQHKQRARIRAGIHEGELTRHEVRDLRRQQKKIARLERHFERDGYLSKRERRRLHRALDRASRNIARARHDDDYRHTAHQVHDSNRLKRDLYPRHRYH